jgi:RNA polymerase sigma factor (sigma-70 family)
MSLEADVTQAALGDRGAYARLIERTRSLVTSVALAVLRDLPSSEDVAQDVYLAVWRDLRKLRNPASFLPWLRQLTRNRALDLVRRGARRPGSPNAEPPDRLLASVADPTTAGVSAEERSALEQALEELPDDAREVLALYYREGRSVAQVATLLGLREATVKKRLQRARDALRRATFEKLGEVLERSAPGAGFTAAVLSGLATTAPQTASAATLGLAGAGASKLAAAGASAVGIVLGAIGVLGGMALVTRNARDDEERRALARFTRVNLVTTVVCAVVMPICHFVVPNGLGLAVGFGAFYLVAARNYLVGLPRITAAGDRRLGTGGARRAAMLRYQRMNRVMIVVGGLIGAATVAYLIWLMRR